MTDSSNGFEWPSSKEEKCAWMGMGIYEDFDMLERYLNVVSSYISHTQDNNTEYITTLVETGEALQGICDTLNYQASVMARVMYACFGISVFSVIEKTIKIFCKVNGIEPGDGAKWKAKRDAINNELAVDINTFHTFRKVTELRLLSNCFKHNGGRPNYELARGWHCETDANEEIKYEKIDWGEIVEASKQFLEELVEKNR